MRYWWVNQNQTYRAEVPGGYLWSPKTRSDGVRNQFYVNMTLVQPGDLVLSYADTRIKAIGIALGDAYDAPRPTEFGSAGDSWSAAGWRVDVEFTVLDTEFQVRPKDFIHDLRAHLPTKYSPLTSSGNGLQSVYLAAIPESLASRLLSLAGPRASALVAAARDSDPQALRERSEDRLIQFIQLTPLGETEKQALVAARRGQGRFRNGVQLVEPHCRITGVSNPEILTASHIRPWNRCADHLQRLDPFNGLLLTPTFDRLFDRGLMSFGNRGQILVSRELAPIDAQRIGLDPDRNVGAFRQEQLPYLEYHRDLVFRQ